MKKKVAITTIVGLILMLGGLVLLTLMGDWFAIGSGKLYTSQQIFTNLEKDPDSLSRYYPLFCMQLDKPGVRHAVMALVVNDGLYAYARSLPPLPPGEKG